MLSSGLRRPWILSPGLLATGPCWWACDDGIPEGEETGTASLPAILVGQADPAVITYELAGAFDLSVQGRLSLVCFTEYPPLFVRTQVALDLQDDSLRLLDDTWSIDLDQTAWPSLPGWK